MLELTRGYRMSSGLIIYLEGELDRLGWTQARLAEEADITPGAISKLFRKRSTRPDLETLSKLARAIKQPLTKLVAAEGYDPGAYQGHPQAEQVALLLETVPALRELHETVVELPPEDLQAVLSYALGRKR